MVLPNKIYLINSQGQYYSCDGGVVTVKKTVPDPSCVVVVEYLPNNPDEFYLRTSSGAYFQYHKFARKGDHIDHKFTPKFPKRAIKFSVLNLKEQDTFVFRSSKGSFLTLRLNAKKRITLGGFQDATIKVGDPAIKKLVTNLVYDFNKSTITDSTPNVALRVTIRNDGPDSVPHNLEYEYPVYNIGTWKNEAGEELLPKDVGPQVPGLVEGRVSMIPYLETLPKIETKKKQAALSLPGRTKASVSVYIYSTRLMAPFGYEEKVWYESGTVEVLRKRGAYTIDVVIGVDTEVTDLVPLTHTY